MFIGIAVLLVVSATLFFLLRGPASPESPGITERPGVTEPSGAAEETQTPGPTGTGHITLAQFKQVEKGMTFEEVAALLGSEGTLQSEAGEKDSESYLAVYAWRGAAEKSKAVVVFTGGKAASMTQLGLTDGA
jgi:hypothetical protein